LLVFLFLSFSFSFSEEKNESKCEKEQVPFEQVSLPLGSLKYKEMKIKGSKTDGCIDGIFYESFIYLIESTSKRK